MISKATVVGTGAMATVVAQILAHNGVHVALLARDEARAHELLVARENRRYLAGFPLQQRITPTADAAAALRRTELVISATPCQHLRATWEPYAGEVPTGAPICSVTKGIEIATLARPSEILRFRVPESPIAVLSGPNVAPEMARCLPTTAVVAGEPRIAEHCRELLTTSWFRVYTSVDVIGVELAGAVKNVIGLAAGILDGLHAGDNAKSALVTRGLVEITRLGVALGAREETFVGLAGIGDLVTTCVSPIGRNRSAGERIGRGESAAAVQRDTPSVIEGIPTTRAVLELAKRHDVEMPITQAVHDVLFASKAPLAAISELMNRPPKPEAGW